MGTAAALIMLVAGLASAYFQYQSNQDLMKGQQDWNEKMLDKQNEYNQPINQVEREQEAGLFRNSLAMGQGTAIGGTSAPVNPLTLIPSIDPMSQASGSLQSLLSGMRQGEEAKDIKTFREARYQNILKQNQQLEQNVINLKLNNSAQYIANQYAAARQEWALLEQQSKTFLNYRQMAVFDKQISKMEYELTHILPEEYQKIISERNINILNLDKVIAEISNINADTLLRERQAEEAQSRSDLNRAQTDLTKMEEVTEGLRQGEIAANTDVANKLVEKYGEEISLISKNVQIAEQDVYYHVFDYVDKVAGNSKETWFARAIATRKLTKSVMKAHKEGKFASPIR